MGGGEHVSMESMHGLVGIRVLVCVYVCGEGGVQLTMGRLVCVYVCGTLTLSKDSKEWQTKYH